MCVATLTSLTIEDNPIITLEQCIPYTIYCIRSLTLLNNRKITGPERESAIKRFNTIQVSQVKDLLANEVKLKSEIEDEARRSRNVKYERSAGVSGVREPSFGLAHKPPPIAFQYRDRTSHRQQSEDHDDYSMLNISASTIDTQESILPRKVGILTPVPYTNNRTPLDSGKNVDSFVGGIASSNEYSETNYLMHNADPPVPQPPPTRPRTPGSTHNSILPLPSNHNIPVSRQIIDLNNRLEKLTVRLLDSESSKKTLIEENKRLERLLVEKDYETNKLNTAVSDLESQISYLKSKVNQHQQQEEYLNEKERELNVISSPQRRVRSSLGNCDACVEYCQQLDDMESALNSQLKSKDMHIKTLESKIEELQDNLRSVDTKKLELEKALIDIRAENQQYACTHEYNDTVINGASSTNSEKYLSLDAADLKVASNDVLITLVLSLKKEVGQLRSQNDEQMALLEKRRHDMESRARTDQFETNELNTMHRVELMKYDTQIDVLKNTHSRTEAALQSSLKDIQLERERYSHLEMNFENSQRKIVVLEEKMHELLQKEKDFLRENQRLHDNGEAMQRELQTERKLKEKAVLDIEFYRQQTKEREDDLSAYLSIAANGTPSKPQDAPSGNRRTARDPVTIASYLDEEDEDDEEDCTVEVKDGERKSYEFATPLQDIQFSRLEVAAAQSIAGMLFTELKSLGIRKILDGFDLVEGYSVQNPSSTAEASDSVRPGPGGGGFIPAALKRKLEQNGKTSYPNRHPSPTSNGTSSTSAHHSMKVDPSAAQSTKPLRVACGKAALRLLHYILSKHQTLVSDSSKTVDSPEGTESVPRYGVDYSSNNVIAPLESMLRDKSMLASIVNETQMSIKNQEESHALRYEQKQLNIIIEQLNAKEKEILQTIQAKENMLNDINEACVESKRQGQLTVMELEGVAKQLNSARIEINKLEVDRSNIQRDIELKKTDLNDVKSCVLREQKSMNSMRDRMSELSIEYQQINDSILKAKEVLISEEQKMRQVKTVSVEQLHSLQLEVNKLSNDFHEKQRVIEDLDRERKTKEEEFELRRSEMDRQTSYLIKEIEEKTRRVTHLKNDYRTLHLDYETLTHSKKQLEVEITRHSETLNNEVNQLHSQQVEYKHLIEHYERVAKESERKMKNIKEKNGQLEMDQLVLRESVEELRRQQEELDKINENRRRAHEEELNQVQRQLQAAIRLNKQTVTITEQKRSELDAFLTESRSCDRKVELSRNSVRELENTVDHLKETIRNLELDRENRLKSFTKLKEEEDTCRKEIQILHIQIDADARALEDTKKRYSLLTADEENLKEIELKLKHNVNNLKKLLITHQQDLDTVRSDIEKEKRELMDLQSKRSILEVHVEKNDAIQRNGQELAIENEKKRVGSVMELQKLRDDIVRTQKELLVAERKVTDAEQKEGEYKRKTETLQAEQMQLKTELDALKMVHSNEKRLIESLREEGYDKQDGLNALKTELKQTQLELHKHKMTIETCSIQQKAMEETKDQLMQEIARLRDNLSQENAKADKVEAQYGEIESRLKKLRIELSKTEVN